MTVDEAERIREAKMGTWAAMQEAASVLADGWSLPVLDENNQICGDVFFGDYDYPAFKPYATRFLFDMARECLRHTRHWQIPVLFFFARRRVLVRPGCSVGSIVNAWRDGTSRAVEDDFDQHSALTAAEAEAERRHEALQKLEAIYEAWPELRPPATPEPTEPGERTRSIQLDEPGT